jgi:hypothetical protein
MNNTKVLGYTNWGGEAFNLASKSLLICSSKFSLSPLNYGAIQSHFELFNGIVLNLGGLDGLDSLPTYFEKWCI